MLNMTPKMQETFKTCCEKAWALWRRLGFAIDSNIVNSKNYPLGPVGLVTNEIVAYGGSVPEETKKIEELLSPEEIKDIRKGFRPLKTLSGQATVRIEEGDTNIVFSEEGNSCVIKGMDLTSLIAAWNIKGLGHSMCLLQIQIPIRVKNVGCVLDGIDISEVIKSWEAWPSEDGVIVEMKPNPLPIMGVL